MLKYNPAFRLYMAITIQKANERGGTPMGWLTPRFSFSFSNYYNPDRIGFGALRVLNDDIIAPSAGFGTHPHDNMEIITIPLKGTLAHKDSTGQEGTLTPGVVQVMSAGKGVLHSEYNGSNSEELNLFQIWIEPHTLNVEPRYAERQIPLKKNELNLLVSGNEDDDALFIYQDAKIYRSTCTAGTKLTYTLPTMQGLFLIVVSGSMNIAGKELQERDSIEITELRDVELHATSDADFVLIEVPVE